MHRTLRIMLALWLALLAPVVAAQVPPDAGQLQQRQQEPLRLQPLPVPAIQAPAMPPPTPEGGAALIQVRLLRITGATVFAAERLHALVADAEGRSLSLADLRAIAGRITRFYGEQGYPLARAYLPPQEVQSGVVEITVAEGRLEQVDSEDRAGLSTRLRARLNAGLVPGRPLRQDVLERAVLLNDALPGISASARLRAGDAPGTTRVIMETRMDNAVSGEASVDNHGDRYTGRNQAGLRLDWNNPGGIGDQLSLRAQGSGEGRWYGRAAYDFSLSGPWRATVAGSRTHYELGKEFSSLDADGRAGVLSLDLRYPLLLTHDLHLDAGLGADAMHLVDRIALTASERNKELQQARLGFSLQAGNRGRGQSALSLQLATGRVDIRDAGEAAVDASSLGSEGGFTRLNLAAERWQALGDWQLRGSANLQRALQNLASAEKLSIGGADGVRAYPAGEAQGDDGNLFSLELRRPCFPTPAWVISPLFFADYGRVRFNHSLWPGFTGDTRRELAGAGVGVEVAGHGVGVSAMLAWPLTDTAFTSEPDRGHMAWVSARLGF